MQYYIKLFKPFQVYIFLFLILEKIFYLYCFDDKYVKILSSLYISWPRPVKSNLT